MPNLEVYRFTFYFSVPYDIVHKFKCSEEKLLKEAQNRIKNPVKRLK